jgi:hypothetical protein
MSLTTLTSKELSRIQKLIERKESLVRQIADINNDLESFETAASAPAAPSKPAAPAKAAPTTRKAAKAAKAAARAKPQKNGRVRKARPGGLRDRVVNELKSAGPKGIKVADLAAKLGTSYGNVTAFFKGTAKKISEIEKAGPAQWAWRK